jgi:acyl-CoA thioester hydrolase
MSIYHHPIKVTAADLDEMNHVNNVVYVQWVQDAASAHWISKAPAEVKEKYNWVVLRHEIDYKSPAVLHDELIAKTWVANYDGVKSDRMVQIIRTRDERLLVEAKTTWCLLNAANNRPARIGEEIRNVFMSASA